MNANTSGRYPILYVEGKNDLHVICNLLRENGITLSPQDGPVVIDPKESVDQVLDVMVVAIKSAVGRRQPVGFVLDVDKDSKARWDGIRSRLREIGCKLSKADICDEGVIKDIGTGRVGIWTMPYPKAKSGKLEDFLREIVPIGDKMLPLAQKYIGTVRTSVPENKRFRSVDADKAEMAAWLSVQDPPGIPYGVAIKAHAFSPTMPLARKFVEWFRRLYSL